MGRLSAVLLNRLSGLYKQHYDITRLGKWLFYR
jgi:hypothetical protein